MNSSKKIIDTLRSADKASVEKLMDEAARKEDIFARIQERTGAQNSDYTDVEAGVEKYGRRISITRMVSAAAAIAVLAGAVGGGVYLMRRPNPTDDDLNITNTTDGQLTTDESIPAELTKDFLYDRVVNYEDHYRRFSCDYEITDNSEGIIPFTVSGSVCVDKDGDKGWCSSEKVYHGNDTDVKLSENTRIIEYYCGGYDVHAQGNWADDSGSELTGKEYTMSYARHDSVYLPVSPVDCGSLSERIGDKESWEITGDRTENGRRIATIEGKHHYATDNDSNEAEVDFIVDIDVSSGIRISQKFVTSSGDVVFELNLTNCKFEKDAEAPVSPSDFFMFVVEGDYAKSQNSEFDIIVLSDYHGDVDYEQATIDPRLLDEAMIYVPVQTPVTAEAHDVPAELTGEFLRERSLGATHYYDRFSGSWTATSLSYYSAGENGTYKGSIKIDNTTMTGEYDQSYYDADGVYWNSDRSYFLNNIFVKAHEYDEERYSQLDLVLETKTYGVKSTDSEFDDWKNKPDRVMFFDFGGFDYIRLDNNRIQYNGIEAVRNESEWTITGERTENGRRIAGVSFSYEQLHEGQYYPVEVTADIDVETGIWLAYEVKDDSWGNGTVRTSFRMTDYKFDDEAEAPMTANEVSSYLDDNGFKSEGTPLLIG